MMTTTDTSDRDAYVKAWESHINSLAVLFLNAADHTSFEAMNAEYAQLRARLMGLVEESAPEEV